MEIVVLIALGSLRKGENYYFPAAFITSWKEMPFEPIM